MADDDILVPNPDGCTAFDPHPFKKETCKSCRRRWEEHKDAIDPRLLQEFLEARRKAAEEKEKARTAQLEKERAKAAAKKKANQAVEDEWYFEGKEEAGDDSDGGDGFRMVSTADMKPKAQSQPKQQLVVKNLIDFGECDAADPTPAEPPQKLADTGDLDLLAGSGNMPDPTAVMPAFSPRVPQDDESHPQPSATSAFPDSHLRAELEHLEMRLAQANEQKKIELEIVNDELQAKDRMVAELKQERDLANERLKAAVNGNENAIIEAPADCEVNGLPKVSETAAELVLDLQTLCAEAPALNGHCPGTDEAQAGRTGCRVRNMGDLEKELRKVRQFITSAVEAARETQEPRTASLRFPGAEALATQPTNGKANASEAQLAVQAISEISATAFREIRTSADTQIAWIKQRLSRKPAAAC